MRIIDGKAVSAAVRERVRLETEELKKKGIRPGLAVIIVGDDPASQVYVRNKEKACAEVGFYSEKYALPSSTTQQPAFSSLGACCSSTLFGSSRFLKTRPSYST